MRITYRHQFVFSSEGPEGCLCCFFASECSPGDTQSTCGTEPSPMRDGVDGVVNIDRGYETWLKVVIVYL